MEHRQYSGNGYTLQCIRTDKFKTFSIALRFADVFSVETINARAILPEVLLGGTRKSPSREALQSRMDGLYGLSVSAGTEKDGMESVLCLDLKAVEGQYLPGGASTLPEALDLLQEIIYEPKMIRGQFRKKTVTEEIRLLKEDFEAEYADKPEWAYQRFVGLMFETELHRFRAKGRPETLGDLTIAEVTQAYRKMLETDHVTILAVGNFEGDELAREIARRFSFGTSARTEEWIDRETMESRSPRKVVEPGEVNQARLHVGYRLPIRFGDPLFHAATLTNAVLGEFDHSKLFQVVREEQTLCYFINSGYDSNKGFVSVLAGTDPEKVQIALDLIDQVLDRIREGDISEEELALAKESVSKRIRQNADSPERLATLDFLYHKVMGRGYSPEQSLANIRQVTKADVMAISRMMKWDTTYVLGGRNGQ